MSAYRLCAVATLFMLGTARAAVGASANAPAPIEAGAAAVDITPNYPVRLSGFGFRRTESEGVTKRIWAKALAIGSDEQGPAVVLAVDNLGLPDAMVEEVAARLKRRHGIDRERFAATFTHTHTAPMLKGVAPTLFAMPIPEEHQQHIDRYTQELTDRLEQAALAALADRQPARLSWGVGSLALSKNRRTPGGPVDHDLPLLAIKDLNGALRAVWISYACHCVTLSNNRVSGDWAGYAQEAIQKNHPGAVAMVSIGCGADSNPISGVTGDKVEIAAGQGAEVAAEVDRLLAGFLAPITKPVTGRFERFDLPLDRLPDRAEWERRAKQGSYVGYHAQAQLNRLDRGEKLKDHLRYSAGTWTFGDELAIAFLPGEVVVDYSLRLKRELDRSRLWINGYSNDAPCYIPSERVLREGGYEGATAMHIYDVPTKFAPGLEDTIVAAVRKQLPDAFQKPVDAGEGAAKPLSPQQSGALIRTKPGLVAELVAAEPLISDPVAIDFGHDGRMWVAEMHDYPSGLDGDYSPGGRVRLVTDADGDGRYDYSRIFLDGIAFPTGVTVWHKGVLVCAAPDILYAEDTDGDDVADVRRVLYRGFGTGNYQARVNSLAFGLDNWIHGSCGLFGGQITTFASDKPYPLGDRDFRIQPDSGAIAEATGRTQQGRARDDWGNWFGCDNSNLARHYPLTEHYLRRNPFVAPPPASVNVPDYPEPNRLHPASQSLQRFKLSGPSARVTAACGLGVYRDDLLGEEFSNNLFTCEPVNLLVHRLLLKPKGATFKGQLAKDETQLEFLASTDNWFRPVQARTGPDGALYVVDMYRFIIEHPRWIPPEALAALDVRAGHSLGRIYRVYPRERPPRPIERLDRLDTDGLVAALDSPNGPRRDLAQAMLRKQHVLLRNELEELAATGKSLMPDGLEREMPPAEMSDLLAYLQPAVAAAPKSAAELAAAILDEERPAKDREAIINEHAYDAGELVAALAAGLENADEKEEYRRIPWIWRVSIAAGRRADGAQIKSLLAAALPRPDERLADWQAVVIGGGAINGLSQAGHWPGDYIDGLLKHDEPLASRWRRAIELSSAMADNAKVRNGTRYDALRMVAMDGWERRGEQLAMYLAEGTNAELEMGAISGLADVHAAGVGPLLLSGVGDFTPTNRALALDALFRDDSRISALLDAVAAGQVSAATLGDARVAKLLAIRNDVLRARAEKLLGPGKE